MIPKTETAARSFRWLLWTLALLGLVADQTSKYTVFPWLHKHGLVDERNSRGRYYQVIPLFRLHVSFREESETGSSVLGTLRRWNSPELPDVNQGALFGLGNDQGAAANAIFAVVSVLAAVAIAYWSFRRSTAKDWFLCTALGLILAGTVGNLYDRVVFGGVRDFLFWYWERGRYEWPVFNLADCCLVCGAALLLLQAFWNRKPAAEPAPAVALTAEVANAK